MAPKIVNYFQMECKNVTHVSIPAQKPEGQNKGLFLQPLTRQWWKTAHEIIASKTFWLIV